MRLNSIELRNFRNYPQLNLNFNKPNIMFFGVNAEGKTNLLEAIYYLGTGKSHRANKEDEVIRWNTSGFYLKGEIERQEQNIDLEVFSKRRNTKKFRVNGLTKSKVSDFIGKLNTVMFSPEDLMLIKGEPSNRRKFLNLEISQIDPAYDYHLKRYHRALKQRNYILKTHHYSQDKELIKNQISVWDKQLAEHGIKIIEKRNKIVYRMAILARLIYRKITSQKENLEIKYLPSFPVPDKDNLTEEYFLKKLNDNFPQHLAKKTTGIGPHRDDLAFFIEGRDARYFGSQGQQRTTVLSLKMAELELMKGETGEYPILLLDDVLSELDNDRRKHLLTLSEGKVQTFITGTSSEDFKGELLKKAQIFNITDNKAVEDSEVHQRGN